MRNLLRNLAYASIIVAATAVTVMQFNRPAGATGAGTGIVAIYGQGYNNAVDSNGDVYLVTALEGSPFSSRYMGNIYGAAPINVEPSTWSGIKAKGGKAGN